MGWLVETEGLNHRLDKIEAYHDRAIQNLIAHQAVQDERLDRALFRCDGCHEAKPMREMSAAYPDICHACIVRLGNGGFAKDGTP